MSLRDGCGKPGSRSSFQIEGVRLMYPIKEFQEEPCPRRPGVKIKNGKQMRRYQCPFCQQHVNSTIAKVGELIIGMRAEKSSVSLAAMSPAACTSTHAQPAEQLFTQKRQRAESKPPTQTMLDAPAAGKGGPSRHRCTNNTASPQLTCDLLQLAFVLHSSGPRTLPQGQNTKTPWQ